MGTFHSNTTVSVGPVSPTDFDAKFKNNFSENVYLDYKIQSKYEKDSHIYMMPTAFWNPNSFGVPKRTGATISASYASPSSVSFVQLAAPTLLWIVDWTCSRVNERPEIPNPILINSYGWILVAEHYEPAMLKVAGDGISPVWRISGTYVYGHVNPSLLTIDDLVFPRPPWLEEFVERAIPRGMLTNGLIDRSINLPFMR